MKKKYLVLIGLLLPLAVFLSGCAGGLTASAWPAMTADAKNVYLAGGPYVYAVNLQTGAQVWRFPASASAATTAPPPGASSWRSTGAMAASFTSHRWAPKKCARS